MTKLYKVWLYIEKLQEGEDEEDVSVQYGGPWVALMCKSLEQAIDFVEDAEMKHIESLGKLEER